jgi:hypothetical protein
MPTPTPMPIFSPIDKPVAAALFGGTGEVVAEAVDDDAGIEDVVMDEVAVAFGFTVVGLPLLMNSP